MGHSLRASPHMNTEGWAESGAKQDRQQHQTSSGLDTCPGWVACGPQAIVMYDLHL